MKTCAICGKEIDGGVVVDIECLDKLKKRNKKLEKDLNKNKIDKEYIKTELLNYLLDERVEIDGEEYDILQVPLEVQIENAEEHWAELDRVLNTALKSGFGGQINDLR